MKKILMVCLGNICRSPVAEGILRYKIMQKNLNAAVDSAGTSSYHAGEHPDRRAILHAKKHGIDISNLVARAFEVSDFDAFDKIYVMDSSNYRNVISLARNAADREKVEMILNTIYPGSNMSVPDPYYGGDRGFENVFLLLDRSCETITRTLEKKVNV